MSVDSGLPTDGHRRESVEPTPAQFAEAAAWVTRLHGPNRTAGVERGLRRWLDASASHAAAFEAMNAAWDVTGRLRKDAFPPLSRWQRAGYRDGFIRSALLVASVAAIAIGTFFYVQQREGIITGVGEQRVMTLEDGTRITLNTDTRVKVDYTGALRGIELRRGEALFEVARNPRRPFVVRAGDRQVRALGTSFVVRREADELEVTLVEGKVAVSASSVPDVPSTSLPDLGPGSGAPASDAEITLIPGQRLTVAHGEQPTLDQPAIEKVIAWRRGLVDFENTPLSQAVAEMNRYSAIKLIVEDPRSASIPITGVFRAGDAASLAAAIARAYHLEVSESQGSIRLTRATSTLSQEP